MASPTPASAINQQRTSTLHELIANATGLSNRILAVKQRVAHDDQTGGRDHKTEAGVGLVDKKFFEPESPVPRDIFREWAEDFAEYIRSRDEELATIMETCKYATHAVSSSTLVGLSACDEERHRGLYRVMKKLFEPPQGRGRIGAARGGQEFL